MLAGPSVRQITSDAFSLRHLYPERVDGIRVGNEGAGAGRLRQGQAMGQQLQSWRSGDGERLWLSMLVDTMDKIAGSEFRGLPCSPSVRRAVEAQLVRPASGCYASPFSLRN
jgi:hypothetical protein